MDRKKTIVVTVMINAGLLAVLFIAALTTREKDVTGKEQNKGPRQIVLDEQKQPLYAETMEITPPTESLGKIATPVEQSSSFVLPPIATDSQNPSSSLLPKEIQPQTLSSLEIVVQKGDSLEKIAKKYRIGVDELLKANSLSSSFLKEGQHLKIPEGGGEKTAKPRPLLADQTEYYTMKVGDNPWSIAMKYHMKVEELLRLNGLNEKTARKLKPGDRLKVK